MTLQRIFIIVTILLFGAIGAVALVKKQKSKPQVTQSTTARVFEGQPIEIDLKKLQSAKSAGSFAKSSSPVSMSPQETQATSMQPDGFETKAQFANAQEMSLALLPEVDRINLLFQKESPLPICETIRYKARPSWKQGRSAWLVDYAAHYNTSVDFIARSINGRPDYTVKTFSEGQQFNILRNDKDFYFSLVIDLSRCKLWLYYVDPEEQEHFLLKTYRVGLGRLDSQQPSGSLTPLGSYKLGSRIAVFKPKMMGLHKNKRVELIQVFGTRWIPFESEVENCTAPAKGYGIHGTPWNFDEDKQALVSCDDSIGKYESDGCIRLRTEDIEEVYAVISTRDTYVQVVRDFSQAKLPFKEKVKE